MNIENVKMFRTGGQTLWNGRGPSESFVRWLKEIVFGGPRLRLT